MRANPYHDAKRFAVSVQIMSHIYKSCKFLDVDFIGALKFPADRVIAVERLGFRVDFQEENFEWEFYDIVLLWISSDLLIQLHKNPNLALLSRDAGDPVLCRSQDHSEIVEVQ